MEGVSFLYETLAPLTTSTDSISDPSESYSVFRTQISASTPLSSQLAAPDYFSLDTPTESASLLTESPSPPSQPSPPRNDPSLELAWFRSDGRFKSPMLKLHKEILDFCEFLSPTQEEQGMRAAAVQRVFEVVKYIWPHCQVEVFGSFKTGLYLPTSDIDVVILEAKVRTPQIGLQAVSRALSQRGIANKIQVIAKARVPIVKFVERQSGVAFDISFDVNNGPKAADFIKDAVAKIPPLRSLCLILKVFLQQRELNEVYSGGIGSYALLTMLIAHLQIHWRAQDFKGGQTSIEHNLGILLVNFFDFYGRKLNTWDVGISCKSTGSFFLKSIKGFQKSERPYLLSIEDPQAPDNDIGRNSFNYFQIRSAFAMAYSLLTDAKTVIGLGPGRSILGMIIRPDSVLLERKGGCNGEMTFDSLLPGAGQPVQRQLDDDHDIQCNWHLYDDEPLPRGNANVDDDSIQPPRKRKASKLKHATRTMENGEIVAKHENVWSRDQVDDDSIQTSHQKKALKPKHATRTMENGERVTARHENVWSRDQGMKQHWKRQDGDSGSRIWRPWHDRR